MKRPRHCLLFAGLLWMFLLPYVIRVPVAAQKYVNNDEQTHGDHGDEPIADEFIAKTKCCNQSTNSTHRVEVEFTTSVVQNEYIVRFDGYYLPTTREKYVKAALNESQVIVSCGGFPIGADQSRADLTIILYSTFL